LITVGLRFPAFLFQQMAGNEARANGSLFHTT
jgi:hypothetical protein